MPKSYFLSSLLLVLMLIIMSSCNRDKDEYVLYTQPYEFDFTVPAGLNAAQTHVFEFIKVSTLSESIFQKIDKERVKSIKVSNARLAPIFSDSDLKFFRKIEVWVEKHEDPDNKFYDCAYTFDLQPRDINSYIQLIPSNQEYTEVYEEKFFDLYIRNYFYSIPNRTQRFRLLLDISFYENE